MKTTDMNPIQPALLGRGPALGLLACILAMVASARLWAAANLAVRFDPPPSGETSLQAVGSKVPPQVAPKGSIWLGTLPSGPLAADREDSP